MSVRAWTGFAAMSVLWGIPYLFIKIGVDDGLSPAFLSWARVVLAAAVLLPLAWRAEVLSSLRGSWGPIALFGVIEVAVPFPLIAAGEEHVDSSLAAILIAAAPLMVAVIAIRFDQSERVSGVRLAGLLIGFAGVVALVGLDVAGRSEELLGVGAILLAAACYAVGPLIMRRYFAELDPRATMGAALGIAALALAPFAAIDAPDSVPSGDGLVAIVVLGLLSTALAFVIWSPLVREIGAGRALVITYVAPVVALALGIAVLDERPGAGAILGLALILVGSWLSMGRRTSARAAISLRAR